MGDQFDPLTGQLEGLPGLGSGPGLAEQLAELWRTIIPWEDLQAKGVDARHLSLGRDIMPALAALVAMGPDRPRLLAADYRGILQAVTQPWIPDQLGESTLKTDSVIRVTRPELHAVGEWLRIVGALDPLNPGQGDFYTVQAIAGSRLTLNRQVGVALSSLNPLLIVPAVAPQGPARPWERATVVTRIQSNLAINGTATLIAANSGNVYLHAGVIHVTIPAASTDFQLQDTDGNVLIFDTAYAGAPAPHRLTLDFRGYWLGFNNGTGTQRGLVLVNGAGAAMNFRGYIGWTPG